MSGHDVLAAMFVSVLLRSMAAGELHQEKTVYTSIAIAAIKMTKPSKLLRGPNGSRGSSVMSEGMRSCGPLRSPGVSGAHSVCDRIEAAFCTVKKMYNK